MLKTIKHQNGTLAAFCIISTRIVRELKRDFFFPRHVYTQEYKLRHGLRSFEFIFNTCMPILPIIFLIRTL